MLQQMIITMYLAAWHLLGSLPNPAHTLLTASLLSQVEKETSSQPGTKKRKQTDDTSHTQLSYNVACLPFTVSVRTLLGKLIAFTLDHNGASVQHLKHLIFEAEGIPEDQQRLIFCGKQLEDDRSLANYHIQREATLDLCLRLRGC